MKKSVFLFLALIVLMTSTTVSAKSHHYQDSDDKHQKNGRQETGYEKQKHNHHDWSHEAYHDKHWQKGTYESISFGWHERSDRFEPERYRMEYTHDEGWRSRFPGLRPYHWEDRHGEGFWYRGHHVKKAMFFYNDADELVSIGFMHNGVFLFIRDDHSAYRNHDSFFISWSSRG